MKNDMTSTTMRPHPKGRAVDAAVKSGEKREWANHPSLLGEDRVTSLTVGKRHDNRASAALRRFPHGRSDSRILGEECTQIGCVLHAFWSPCSSRILEEARSSERAVEPTFGFC